MLVLFNDNELAKPDESASTNWDSNKMATNLQTTILWMKIVEFLFKFHWSLFLRVWLTISQYWFRWWLGKVQAPSHYLNQWWPSLQMNKCTGLQRINSMDLGSWQESYRYDFQYILGGDVFQKFSVKLLQVECCKTSMMLGQHWFE